jgi:hypothetical protein
VRQCVDSHDGKLDLRCCCCNEFVLISTYENAAPSHLPTFDSRTFAPSAVALPHLRTFGLSMADAAPSERTERRCAYPMCTYGDDLPPKQCPFLDCEEVLHHCCFTAFCARHEIADPEGEIDRYCWSCVTEMLAEDDPKMRAAVESEIAAAAASDISQTVAVPPTEEALRSERPEVSTPELFGEAEGGESTLPQPTSSSGSGHWQVVAHPPPTAIYTGPPADPEPPADQQPPAPADQQPPADQPSPSTTFPKEGDRLYLNGDKGVVIQANTQRPSQLAVVFDRKPLSWHLVDVLSETLPRYGSDQSHFLIDEVEPEFSVRGVIRSSRGSRLPTAYLIGPTSFTHILVSSPQWWQFYGGLSPALSRGRGGMVETPTNLKDEVLVGHHIQYQATSTCSWEPNDAAANEDRPTAGDALLYAMAVGWDGHQRRQYALLQPLHDPRSSLFMVSWEAIQGRHPSKKAAVMMETMDAKKDILKTFATEKELRTPSSINAALNRTRRRHSVSNAASVADESEAAEEEANAEEEATSEGGEVEVEEEEEDHGKFCDEPPSDGDGGGGGKEDREEEEEEEEEEDVEDDEDDLPVRQLFPHLRSKAKKAAALPPIGPPPPAATHVPPPTAPPSKATKKVPNDLKGWGFAKISKLSTPEVTPLLSSALLPCVSSARISSPFFTHLSFPSNSNNNNITALLHLSLLLFSTTRCKS